MGGENHAHGQEGKGFWPVSQEVAPSGFCPRDAVRVQTKSLLLSGPQIPNLFIESVGLDQ